MGNFIHTVTVDVSNQPEGAYAASGSNTPFSDQSLFSPRIRGTKYRRAAFFNLRFQTLIARGASTMNDATFPTEATEVFTTGARHSRSSAIQEAEETSE